MEKGKVYKNVKGFLEIKPPLFSKEGVYFFNIVNVVCSEGEEWEYEILSPLPTGRKDKRGVLIYNTPIKLVRRIETPCYRKGFFDDSKGLFIVPVYSGDLQVGEVEIPPIIKFMIGGDYVNCVAFLMRNGFIEKQHIINRVSLNESLKYPLPDDVRKEVEDILNRRFKKENFLNKKISYNFDNVVRDLFVYGGEVIHFCDFPDHYDHRELYYGHDVCLYRIGDLVFELDVVEKDELFVEYKNEIRTNAGIVNDPSVSNILRKVARFIVSPSKENRLKDFFNIDFPYIKETEIEYCCYAGSNGREGDPYYGSWWRDDNKKEICIKKFIDKAYDFEVGVDCVVHDFGFIKFYVGRYIYMDVRVEKEDEDGWGVKKEDWVVREVVRLLKVEQVEVVVEVEGDVYKEIFRKRNFIVK